MEIDASDDLAVRLCPDYAVIVWTEGDRIFCRFPDRHLVTFDSPQQLMVTLKHRERIRNHKEMTVGTDASPVQYDIDAVAAAFADKLPRRNRSRITRLWQRKARKHANANVPACFARMRKCSGIKRRNVNYGNLTYFDGGRTWLR
jgi:hypothetical protein